MLGYCLILLSVGSALGGVSIRMPYLNPAGVTYTSYEAASPLFSSPLGVRGFAYGSAYGVHSAAPVAVAHAPVAVAHAAPVAVAHAAPVAHASLIPAVQHVPAVAHVPVTKYEAQPAVIQNLVDVHKPKVATRKFEIRRPAIEKEFYDVEERIVVRPAGKAVVELDQPVSKNQRGPTVVSPALQAVRTLPVAHVAHVSHAVHAPIIAATPQPIHVPAFAHPINVETSGSFISSTVAPALDISNEFPQPAFPQAPQQDFQQPPQQAFPQPPQQAFPQPPQQAFPQPPQQDSPQDFPQQFDDSDSVSVDNPEIARARVQQLQQPDRQDFFRSQQIQSGLQRSQQIQSRLQIQSQQIASQQQVQADLQRNQQIQSDLQRSQQIQSDLSQQLARQQQVQADLQRNQQIQSELNQQIQSQQIARQQQFERQQFDQQQQIAREQFDRQQQSLERRFQIDQIERLFQQQPQIDRRIQPSGLERQMQSDLQARLLQQQPQRFDQPAPQQSFEQGPAPQRLQEIPSQERLRSRPTPLPNNQELQRIQANSRSGEILRSQSLGRTQEIPSFRISAEQSISNQERLINLLTARGGVTEVRGAGENTLGGDQVRTRVLSVTPAPYNAGSQDEKVNTRRIVVNRPITTVEEVDVVEPFTKVERVAVHQPALIKTARVGVASVPTSLPVQTYAHALHY